MLVPTQVAWTRRAEELLVLEMKRHKANIRLGLAAPATPVFVHTGGEPGAPLSRSSSRFERLQSKSRNRRVSTHEGQKEERGSGGDAVLAATRIVGPHAS